MVYYRVSFWDENLQDIRDESGIVQDESFNTAAKRVMDNYSADSVANLYLKHWPAIITEDEVLSNFEESDDE